jgi:hypothetical protein
MVKYASTRQVYQRYHHCPSWIFFSSLTRYDEVMVLLTSDGIGGGNGTYDSNDYGGDDDGTR